MKFLNLFFYSLTNLQKLLPMPQLIYGTLCYFLIPSGTSNLTQKTHIYKHPFFMVNPFAKIQYFLFDKYWIFTMTIPIPTTEECQLFKPHPIPMYLDFNTDVISSVYMKNQIHYLAISTNNQSYFTTMQIFSMHVIKMDFKYFSTHQNLDLTPTTILFVRH